MVSVARQRLSLVANRRRHDHRHRRPGHHRHDKLAKAVREFGGYLAANASAIPNFGERYRAGEIISTSFVESAVNQVISKRMVKKQQMRWSHRGAHLLLQIRTRVLNDTLTDDYRRWYPDFNHTPDRQEQAA